MSLFYVDFGDGTGFERPTDLKSLNSFPSTHVYANPGRYTVTGYTSFDGRTDSTSAMLTITAPKADPAPELATASWDPASATESAPESVVSVTASSHGGALIVGTAAGVIAERNSKPSPRSENNAPHVPAASGQTVLVSVPFLPAGSRVQSQVRIGSSWAPLPAARVASNSTLTLPAMTFMKAGTYTVRLGVTGDPRRYVKVMVK